MIKFAEQVRARREYATLAREKKSRNHAQREEEGGEEPALRYMVDSHREIA